MTGPMLTPKAQAHMERGFQLRQDCVDMLTQVVAEWESDPMSVQCFDARLVERARRTVAELKQRDDLL